MTDKPIVALIHGGFHGAWCWDLLVSELHRRGYRTSAVDLPIGELALGAAAYADVVAADLPEDEAIVVVGHSMGGLVVPPLAERRPVTHMVFLAALYPVPGKSMARQYEEEPEAVGAAYQHFRTREDGLLTLAPDPARQVIYHDCRADLAAWASSRIADQSPTIMGEVTPLRAWPEATTISMAGVNDRCIPIGWQRATARRRFGIDPIELPSGHSPFLSCPAIVADALEHALA